MIEALLWVGVDKWKNNNNPLVFKKGPKKTDRWIPCICFLADKKSYFISISIMRKKKKEHGYQYILNIFYIALAYFSMWITKQHSQSVQEKLAFDGVDLSMGSFLWWGKSKIKTTWQLNTKDWQTAKPQAAL